MNQLLIIALTKSLLVWIGMWILLNKRYKWPTFILYVVLASIFTYYGFLFIGQLVRPALFIFVFTISNLRKDGWIPEAKVNFFHLSIVFITIILGRAWANLITYAISPSNDWDTISINKYGYYVLAEGDELPISLLFKIIICIVVFFFMRKVLKKSGITDFIGRIDAEYSTLLAVGIGTILLCYYGVTLALLIFNVECSGMTRVQHIYMAMLTFVASGLILLSSVIIKKEMILVQRNATLANINIQLYNKQEEIVQKEALIKSLDSKIMDTGNVQKQLRDFKHGQNELLVALGGAIESGDKKVIYELLGQYGIKIQEVSKHELEFPDVSQLKTSQLMPLRFFLLSKSYDAIREKINFTTEMSTEILEIGMPVLDFIDILGIWLNNAIEEAIHTEEKWIHTSFILEKYPDGLTILEVRVTNSCREGTLNPTLANQQGVSTKGAGRGHGLPIVEEMMMKHENIYVNTKVSDGKFMQLLEIVLNAQEMENEGE